MICNKASLALLALAALLGLASLAQGMHRPVYPSRRELGVEEKLPTLTLRELGISIQDLVEQNKEAVHTVHHMQHRNQQRNLKQNTQSRCLGCTTASVTGGNVEDAIMALLSFSEQKRRGVSARLRGRPHAQRKLGRTGKSKVINNEATPYSFRSLARLN